MSTLLVLLNVCVGIDSVPPPLVMAPCLLPEVCRPAASQSAGEKMEEGPSACLSVCVWRREEWARQLGRGEGKQNKKMGGYNRGHFR